MKKVLFTVSAFPPETEIGCIRVGNIARELKRNGYLIDVLSVAPGKNARINQSYNYLDYCNTLEQVSNGKLFSKLFLKRRDDMLSNKSAESLMSSADSSILSKLKATINIHIQFIYSLLRNFDLYIQFKQKLQKEYSNESYDYVFSSYPSLCSIWAGKYAADIFKTTLITDFRDPIFYQHNTFWLKSILNRNFERKAINKSDLITSVSEGILRKYIKDFGYKIHVVYNGFSSIAVKEKKQSKKFRISYVGSLYGGKRDLSSFFNLIKELNIDSEELESKLEICYAGKESHLFNSLAKKYDIEHFVNDFGLLSKKEALDLQFSSDMLLVITWNTKYDQGILTGKLFESFGMKVPIFGIVQGNVPDSEFKKIISQVDGGIVLEEALYNENEKMMLLEKLKILIDKKQKSQALFFYNEKLNEFKSTNVVEKLINRIEK